MLFSWWVVAALICPVLTDSRTIEQWHSYVKDESNECRVNLSIEPNAATLPVFEIVNCDAPDASWNYKFQSAKKLKKGVFDGFGSILLSQNECKDGLKLKKCLKFFRDDIKKIQGNFVQDLLEGNVMIEFRDDSYMIGHVRGSRFMGIKRHFSSNSNVVESRQFSLSNVTEIDPKSGEEKLIMSVDTYGFYRLFKGSPADDKILYVTNDLLAIYKCKISPVKSFVYGCQKANFISEGSACDAEFYEGVNSVDEESEKFIWNLKSNERAMYGESAHPNCKNDWQRTETTKLLKDWIDTMEDQTTNPFWKEILTTGDGNEPDEKQSEISFVVPELVDRSLNFTAIKVYNGDDIIGEAKHVGQGKITFEVADVNRTMPSDLVFDFGAWYSLATMIVPSDDSQKKHLLFGRFNNGVLHGPVRRFLRTTNDPTKQCSHELFPGISFIGRYENGRPTGACWRGLPGNGWIYGRVDAHRRFTGDDIAYIYPDMELAIVGRFKNGLLVAGRESKVIGVRCNRGIMEVDFAEPRGPVYHYEPATNETYGDQPMLADPLDMKYIYVRGSGVHHQVADEGAFAKRDIPAQTTITLHGGLVFNMYETELYSNRTREEIANRQDPSEDAAELFWVQMKYGGFARCTTIIIPADMGSLAKYNATWAHKLNHKFVPNCQYGKILDSPRFGLIGAILTIREC